MTNNITIPEVLTKAIAEGIGKAVDAAVDRVAAQPRQAGPPLNGGQADDAKAGFANFGEYALAVKSACHHGARPDERLVNLATKSPSGMSVQAGSDGGFLVPPEFSSRILQRVYDENSLLGRTDRYVVSGNSLTFPRSNETSRADGSRHGGVQGYWLNEGEQVTASKPGFGRLTMNLHKIAVLVYVTDELLSDSAGVALEQYLTRVGSDEINFLVGDAVLNGTGAGRPLGILNSDCRVTVTKESGQAAATVQTENVVNMWSRMYAPCRRRAVWLYNQDVEPQLLTMTVGSGAGTQVTYLPPGGLSDRPYATLMGRPMIPVEWCPTLGTEGDLILADLSQYVTISRGMVETAASMHLRFDYDEMAFRLIFRLDGQPWWASALTPYQGSNAQSCFVTLQTRS